MVVNHQKNMEMFSLCELFVLGEKTTSFPGIPTYSLSYT